MENEFCLEYVLPTSLPPRGLNRLQAAEYIGVSPSLFDQMVNDGRMPKPLKINTRSVWDLKSLDFAFERLNPVGDDDGEDEWGEPDA